MPVRAAVAIALLLITGLVYGRWTDRWGQAAEVTAAAERLPLVPLAIGEWDGRDVSPEESAVAARSKSPQIVRRYTHRRSGAQVGLLVTCGRPGGMILEHTPTECYKRLGYDDDGGQKVDVGPTGETGTGFAHAFTKADAAGAHRLRLVWAWGDGKRWTFPDRPRVEFARTPVLYKLYVTRELAGDDEPLADDPVLSFLEAALPDVTAALGEPR